MNDVLRHPYFCASFYVKICRINDFVMFGL
jgi:hypothetical protein